MPAEATNKPASGKPFPQEVCLSLLLAFVSYLFFWLLPVMVCLGSWHLFTTLWHATPAFVARWGSWWGGIVLSLGLGSALLLPILLLSTFRAWKSGRKTNILPQGVPLSEGEAPELFEVTNQIRRRARVGQPVELWIDFSAAVGCLTYRHPVSGSRCKAIVIGLPVIAVCSSEDIKLLLSVSLASLSLSAWTDFTTSLYNRARIKFFQITINLCTRTLSQANDYAIWFASQDGGDAKLALRTMQQICAEFQKFWAVHGQMMMQTRHIIPIVEGFRDHWARAHPDDSHGAWPASSLVRSLPSIEARLAQLLRKADPAIETVSWEQAGTVLLDAWKEFVAPKGTQLQGIRVGNIHDLDLVSLGRRALQPPGCSFEIDRLRQMAGHLMATAFAVALSRAGWKFEYTGPSSRLGFTDNGNMLEPFTVVNGIMNGSIDQPAWQATCASYGISELLLIDFTHPSVFPAQH
jgi:hypothetical protein